MRNEFVGSIIAVREVEDTIRATKKYTKGAFSRKAQHPIQGEEFPSKVLTEYYEVYPDMEVGMGMSIIDAVFWLADSPAHIDVLFKYNYLRDKAIVIIHGGNGVVKLLGEGIPGLEEALAKVTDNGNHGKESQDA